MTINDTFPAAAAAIARTLSKLIATSAKAMIMIASLSVLAFSHLMPTLPTRVDQPECDPDQQDGSKNLEARQVKHDRRGEGAGYSETDRTDGAPDSAKRLNVGGKTSNRQRDNERIIAGQHKVNDHDAEQTSPPLRI